MEHDIAWRGLVLKHAKSSFIGFGEVDRYFYIDNDKTGIYVDISFNLAAGKYTIYFESSIIKFAVSEKTVEDCLKAADDILNKYTNEMKWLLGKI
jgi:hypothetical protein